MVRKGGWLERMSARATAWTGSSAALGISVLLIVVWAATGPIFKFSDTWQLVINTGTTIITFLMVFLIQRTQNKDSIAIHMKLNELVAAVEGASNRLIGTEDLSEDEVKILREHFRRLAELAKLDESITKSHSVEEAEADHAWKKAREAMRRRRALRKKAKRDEKAAAAAAKNGAVPRTPPAAPK